LHWTKTHAHPTRQGYNLYVDGGINGAPAQLMIDTGAFATLLHRPFVKRMKIPLHDTPFSSAAVNLCEHDVQVAHIRKQKRRVDTVYTLIAQSPDVIARSFQGSSALVGTGVR